MLRSSQTTTIGATPRPVKNGMDEVEPKRRKTPATMPITIGSGTSAIARFTQPVSPSASISTLVA